MKQRNYDIEFKSNAVNLIKERELSISQVSRDLGVPKSTLHKWIKASDLAVICPGKGYLRPEDEKLKKLQRENEVLRRERDILKKALAIFSST
jgi:transposase